MNSYSPFGLLVALAALSLVATECAEINLQDEQTSMLSQQITDFLKQAAYMNNAEIKIGELAKQNGTAGFGKTYGERMVDEHTEANKELMALAERKGYKLPTGIDPKNQAIWSHLETVMGPSFDWSYCRDMLSAHQNAYDAYRRYVKKASDPDVKAYAEKQIPGVRKQLRIAEESWSAMKDRW